ncbi:MAG: excinuclease ABC subunit UvrA [Deltaproteobacteria bacterium]|nr:excinuclease ABC subunit UvrA [Deltaproteobacteria bacterium]
MTRRPNQRRAREDHPRDAIEVVGAWTHNLKGVSCRIPHGKVTVVTGPSGAGKSSLAFDTVFAEGQRRFVESMSTYARQFLQQMERPPVDAIENILPPVALVAVNSVRNARSTVGTLTEVQDVLRLLFTHLGQVECPRGHGSARAFTPQEVAEELAQGGAGDRFLLVVRLVRPKRKARETLRELIRQGFGRRLKEEAKEVPSEGPMERPVEHPVERLEPGANWPKAWATLPLVLGRFKAKDTVSAALASAVEEGFQLGSGSLEVHGAGEPRFYSRQLGCVQCGDVFPRPTPALFSFNSPLGACPSCQGFGRVVGIDPERVIPDPRRSLAERPFAPWNTPAYEKHYEDLFVACRTRGVPLDQPWQDLDAETQEWIWRGPARKESGFLTLERFFSWLERKIYRVHVRVLLARYRAYTPCLECRGTRLKPGALAVRLEGHTLPELSRRSIEDLNSWLENHRWSKRQQEVAGHLLEQLQERVGVLHRVGLGYLTLDRQARTLSGGETQRIHLAAALGSGLTHTLYVLDEPTIGLHPVDSDRLLLLLRDLAARGNTVLVVEHDRVLIEGADYLIDLGPAAGVHGGELMAQGPPEEALREPKSVTGRFLLRPPDQALDQAARARREKGLPSLEEEIAARSQVVIRGARAHNLKGFDLRLPLGTLVAVTGVSGSGKSTLVENVLYGTYQRSKGVVNVEPGDCDGLAGLDDLEDVILVDQKPLGRSSRSNPVTYVGAYDEVRKIFAATEAAKEAGITAGHFSFNVDRGRCPECKGTGLTEVDMHFMASVSVTCDVCQGRRFRPQTLGIRVQGLTIAEVLELTVDEAQDFFSGARKLLRRLALLSEVGLGYLHLGQPTSTLSGGEAQRLKLASFLDRPRGHKPRLFLFDEPTTGLHLSDIDLLARTLRRLVTQGDGVIVVEHSPDLIARCDWVVDLGPGGGTGGGELLFAGSLQQMMRAGEGPTAVELRRHLQLSQSDRERAVGSPG